MPPPACETVGARPGRLLYLMPDKITHQAPTVSGALLNAEREVQRAALNLELLRIAATVAPTHSLLGFTLAVNTVRRTAAALKLPCETVEHMFAVPMPAFDDPKRPFVNWGEQSAVLWWAMSQAYNAPEMERKP